MFNKSLIQFSVDGQGCVPSLLLAAATAKSLQSCLTLSNPMDCSLPGSSVHGIFQARVLEWGAIAFSTSNDNLLLILKILPLRNFSL